MAWGRVKRGSRYYTPQFKAETPVRDRLGQVISRRNASPESIDPTQAAALPAATNNVTAQWPITDTIGSSFTGRSPSPSPPMEFPDVIAVPSSSSQSPTQSRRRMKRQDHRSTEGKNSASNIGATSLAVEGDSLVEQRSGFMSFQTLDGTENSFPPIKDLHDSIQWHGRSDSTAKRDSIISSSWANTKPETTSQPIAKGTSSRTAWRRRFTPSSWWPCRTYRWVRSFVLAVTRGFQGRRRADFFLTLVLLSICVYAAYTAMDLVLTGLIKGANAQDVMEAANCSVVYVTIPGPIITVSLIAAPPSNSARGTYYYSVINGTTEWQNSVAPPSRSRTITTGTPVLTPSMPMPPSTSGPESSVLLAPGVGTTSITPITQETVISISTIPLLLSSVPPSTVLASMPAPPPASSSSRRSPIMQPSRPHPSFVTPPNLPTSSSASSITDVISSTVGTPVSTQTTQRPGLPSVSTSSLGPMTSNGSATASSIMDEATPSTSVTISSSAFIITSIMPGGKTSVLTRTPTDMVSRSPLGSLTGLSLPPMSSSFIMPSSTLPNGGTALLSISATSSSVAPSSVSSSLLLSAASSLPISITSNFSGGQTLTVTLASTTVLSATRPGSSASSMITASSVALTATLPGGQITTSVSTETTIVGGATSFAVSSPSSTAPAGSPPKSSSTVAKPSSGGFTVPLPGPTVSNSASVVITTLTIISSGSTTIITATSPAAPVSSPFFGFSTYPLSTDTTSLPSSPSSATGSTSRVLISSLLEVTLTSSIPTSGIVSGTTSSPALTVVSSSSVLSPPLFPGSLGTTSSFFTVPSELSSSGVTSSSASLPASSSASNVPSPSPIASSAISTADLSSTFGSSSSLPSTESNMMSTSSVIVIVSIPSSATTLTTTTLLAPGLNSSASSSSSISSLSVSSSSSTSTSAIITPPPDFSTTPITMSSSRITLSNPSSVIFTNTTSSNISSFSPSSLSSSVISSSMSLDSSPPSVASSNPTLPGDVLPGSVNITSSATTSLTSSSAALSTLTSTVTLTNAPAVITSIQPSTNSTSALQARALMTRIVSYGETSVVFVFPTPTIVTTVTYWTGTYPTVTGPEPLDLQTIPPTTRSVQQTPLSELPSFELFAPAPSSFTTMVHTLARPAEISTPTAGASAAAPTHCGESGNFTLSFDDTTVGPNESNLVVVHGLKNPYHHLFYANGFTPVPDKWEPYPAISQPNIAMFLPLTGRLLPNTAFSGSLLPGGMGAGPRASVPAYWFNAHSGFFGCALSGLTPCLLRVSGFRFDAVLKQEVLVAEQNFTLPACWAYVNCRLAEVVFHDGFRALSGIQFQAFTQGLEVPQAFMLDDLELGWWDDSCQAGILRIGHL